MFAHRIRSVYDKLLPKQTKPGRTNIVPTKRYNPGEKVFFRNFKDNKSFWVAGKIERIDSSPSEETVMDVINETFNIPTPLAAPEIRRFKRKRKATNLIIANPKC